MLLLKFFAKKIIEAFLIFWLKSLASLGSEGKEKATGHNLSTGLCPHLHRTASTVTGAVSRLLFLTYVPRQAYTV